MSAVLTFDMGATNCKAVMARFDGAHMTLHDVYRFPNRPIWAGGRYFWDFDALLRGVKYALTRAYEADNSLVSYAFDTWGCCFGFLDQNGRLLDRPAHYMDPFFKGSLKLVSRYVKPYQLFQLNGSEHTDNATVSQLAAYKELMPELFGQAAAILPTPNLFQYFLTGEKALDETLAAIGGLMDQDTRRLNEQVFGLLGFKKELFPALGRSGTVLGNISNAVAKELGIPRLQADMAAGHDTAGAAFAILGKDTEAAYLSCGTWSLMGIHTPNVNVSEYAFVNAYCNELDIGGGNRINRGVCGLFVYQQCLNEWKDAGEALDYDALNRMVQESRPFMAYLDLEDGYFFGAGNMERRILDYLQKTGQPLPDSHGQMMRIVLESLAMKHRELFLGLEKLKGTSIETVRAAGGGTKNHFLMQATANAIGKPVLLCSSDCSAIGNAAAQLVANEELHGWDDARNLIEDSFPAEVLLPDDTAIWQEEYQRYLQVVKAEKRIYEE